MADTSLMPLRERVSFGKIPAAVDLPNLIEVQRKSYDRFLQVNIPAQEREEIGLQEVFAPYSQLATSERALPSSLCSTRLGNGSGRSTKKSARAVA